MLLPEISYKLVLGQNVSFKRNYFEIGLGEAAIKINSFLLLFVFRKNIVLCVCMQGKSIGLVLGGGGARGAAHVGMLR